MKRYFICADIHGFYDELISALDGVGFHLFNPEDILVVCGDAFDRGNQALEVYTLLKDLQSYDRLIYIRGNHEDLLFDCVEEMLHYDKPNFHHYSNGTVATITQLERDNKVKEVLSFIEKYSRDYYELGDYIFVHGWIPYTIKHKAIGLPFEMGLEYVPELDATPEEWKRARWHNGMESWINGIKIPNKTIVCGHWHCSWGNYFIHKKGSGEFNPDSDFKPFIDDGIIALDTCTAYTHKINIIVIDENGKLVKDG